MKAIILAAGYATRLYPLTQNLPKPLLEVGGKTILDHLIDQLKQIPEINHAYLVTNHRFFSNFQNWEKRRNFLTPRSFGESSHLKINILDDGTLSNDDRLGAVGDIQFALKTQKIKEDILVLAADNILQFSLKDFVFAYQSHLSPFVCVRVIKDSKDRKHRGIAQLDESNRIVNFEEKPSNPKSKWGVPPFYIYPSVSLSQINTYLNNGGNPDAPGHFLEWLCKQEPVYAYKIEGTILDIGNHDSLEKARIALG